LDALEWLASRPAKASRKYEKRKEDEGKKKGKRGGSRRPIYTPRIDELIEEGFFAGGRKSLDEVLEGLRPKNVPTKGAKARHALLENLKRRVAKRDSELHGAPEEKLWYFWVD